ncbi:expressed unknown protein [Seminavis robusta]|uniref:Transmembrane protein n=1 Tax=Seminavis robusta TaxID=568900 RepID=A0A9N8ECM2_9STRA|nr:expressed unknown protein [Seminavis robusta]|eukprot:Sro750_g197010.1 n/a (160) ;mRNA; f:34025-34757
MTPIRCLVVFLVVSLAQGFNVEAPRKLPKVELKKAAIGAFAAFSIASNVLAPNAVAVDYHAAALPSSTIIAETVTREGVYGEYEVDVTPQAYDDARSTFKDAKETKSKKGKYTALLAVLVVGSFVIPMAQYFWYVRDDDSSDKFFAEDVPDPPQKKGWF